MATCPKCRGVHPNEGVCSGCRHEPTDRTPLPNPATVACGAAAGRAAVAGEDRGPDTGFATIPNRPAGVGLMGSSVVTPPPPPPLPPPVVFKLVVARGQRPQQEYTVYEGRNTVGRFADRPVDIDLTGQEAEGQVWSSRVHAAVTSGRGAVSVEDLNSLNGTWVNGARIAPGSHRVLKPGDVIMIGTVHLRVAVG